MANIIFDNTRDNNGQFQTGYIVSRGTKYVTVQFLTNIQGKRDLTYRLTFGQWDQLPGGDDIQHKCLAIAEYGYEPVKKGHIIGK